MWKPHGIAEVDDVILGCLWSWPKALPGLSRGSIVAKNYSNKIAVIVSTKQFSWFTLTMLGRSLIRHDHLVYSWAGLQLLEAPHSSPVLGICPQLSFPELEAAQEHSLQRVLWSWDHLDWVPDWTLLRFLYKLWRFVFWVRKLLILLLTKTSPFSKFPYLLNLPPTNKE